MPTPARPSLRPASVLAVAALTVGLVMPISASAGAVGERNPVADTASRAEERASRAEERATRAEERAARARARRAERAARRAARAQERAARRAARLTPARRGAAELSGSPGKIGARGGSPESTTHATDRATGRCRVGIESSSKRITVGETVTISGKLTCPTGVSAGDREVTVDRRPLGGGASGFNVAGTATTEADGSLQAHAARLRHEHDVPSP